MAFTSDADESDPESIRRRLMNSLARSWEEVAMIYEEDPRAHMIWIAEPENTALHTAVMDGREDIVERLVESIARNRNPVDVLCIGNSDGDTPLHLAASTGSISMCRCIAGEHKELLGCRNRRSDTPLVTAVRYGKKDVFLSLYDMCEGDKAHDYCQNKNGKNVLHLAIESGHMDLAFQIICKQEDLMDGVDDDGFSPLHQLAWYPTAFRSGIHFSWFNKIIYHCISVEELIPAGTSKAKKNFFQELPQLIKLPGKSKKHRDPENPEEGQGIERHGHNSSNIGAQGHIQLPSKYGGCLRFIKLLVSQVLPVIISVMPGSSRIRTLKEKKQMHVWSLQILDKLLERAVAMGKHGMSPRNDEECPRCYSQYEYFRRGGALETPLIAATRYGIMEMVEKILKLFPMAIYDKYSDGDSRNNMVLEAVQYRQSHIYDFLLNDNLLPKIAFQAVNSWDRTALHQTGRLVQVGLFQHIPTSTLLMQWEVQWYQYVRNSLPPHFVAQITVGRDNPDKIFLEEHQKLVDESKQWLNSTSNSCSFIAALIATVAFASIASVPGGLQWENSASNPGSFIAALTAAVAFASSASVPGGVKQDTGSIFAIAPLVALLCSMISLLIFLAILTSKDQDKDFTTKKLRKFLFGLTPLFISMAAMLTCLFSGNFLMLKGPLKYAAILVYALTGLGMAYFVLKHFTLFIDLLKATFRRVPERIYKEYL